jgi:hypothetical protein
MSTETFDVPSVERVYKLTNAKAEYIVSGFRAVVDPSKIPAWEDRAASIKVEREDDASGMAAARELRLEIRQTRIESENRRKELKEDALRESKAIDGLGKAIRDRLESVEAYLKEQEEFAKRAAEERERLRREEADRLLREKEEREAREREEARLAEEKRIREENERLRKESAEREAAARAEREEHERQMAAERAEREAERRRHEEAERKAEEARQKERERIRKAEEKKREADRKRHEAELAKARTEAERLAALVRCPECGHEFDGREHHVEVKA